MNGVSNRAQQRRQRGCIVVQHDQRGALRVYVSRQPALQLMKCLDAFGAVHEQVAALAVRVVRHHNPASTP